MKNLRKLQKRQVNRVDRSVSNQLKDWSLRQLAETLKKLTSKENW